MQVEQGGPPRPRADDPGPAVMRSRAHTARGGGRPCDATSPATGSAG